MEVHSLLYFFFPARSLILFIFFKLHQLFLILFFFPTLFFSLHLPPRYLFIFSPVGILLFPVVNVFGTIFFVSQFPFSLFFRVFVFHLFFNCQEPIHSLHPFFFSLNSNRFYVWICIRFSFGVILIYRTLASIFSSGGLCVTCSATSFHNFLKW